MGCSKSMTNTSLEENGDEKGRDARNSSQKRCLIDGVGAHQVFEKGIGKGVERKADNHKKDAQSCPIV